MSQHPLTRSPYGTTKADMIRLLEKEIACAKGHKISIDRGIAIRERTLARLKAQEILEDSPGSARVPDGCR
jgi:hypothetical protein